MRFLKSLLIFCFFFVYSQWLRASENLVLTIDSIIHHGANSVLTANIDSGITDSLVIFARLTNNDSQGIYLQDTSLIFQAAVSNSILDTNHFVYTLPDTEMFPGNTTQLTLKMLSPAGSPLPNLLPTGSSVVIWPVYDGQPSIDSAKFVLYQTNPTAINELQNLYSNVFYNQQLVYINFNNIALRTVELYDATGRKACESQSDAKSDAIDWSALPAGIYILRIRQGSQNSSVKLVHF